MKTLSDLEIECLLGIQSTTDHSLDILGYGFSTDGTRRFRFERPNFYPQLAWFIERVLSETPIFPSRINPNDPGFSTFIRANNSGFCVSALEEIGVGRYERILSPTLSKQEAIREYVHRVVNPDYIWCDDTHGSEGAEHE